MLFNKQYLKEDKSSPGLCQVSMTIFVEDFAMGKPI